MTATFRRASADIHPFPVKTRMTSDRSREDATPAGLGPRRDAGDACADGWYHEAAIREAERVRKP